MTVCGRAGPYRNRPSVTGRPAPPPGATPSGNEPCGRIWPGAATAPAERESPLFLAVQRSERRKSLTSRQVSKLFHRSAREANLPLGVTPHRARATCITEALDRKCPIEAVQASVGHRHIATTKRHDQRVGMRGP